MPDGWSIFASWNDLQKWMLLFRAMALYCPVSQTKIFEDNQQTFIIKELTLKSKEKYLKYFALNYMRNVIENVQHFCVFDDIQGETYSSRLQKNLIQCYNWCLVIKIRTGKWFWNIKYYFDIKVSTKWYDLVCDTCWNNN